jgi:hypothetical protein
MSIAETIYNDLKTSTNEIASVIAERDKLSADISSGRYSGDAIQKELEPQLIDARLKANRMIHDALQGAKNKVAQFRKDVASENNLNPADLTDDIKLLQPGIVLMERDIDGMLERNKDNKTMVQVILRYADEHNIKVNRVYAGGTEEETIANNLDTILRYYENWIDKPDALVMLDKFFGV